MTEAFKPTVGLAFPHIKSSYQQLAQGRSMLEHAREYMIPAWIRIRRQDTPEKEKVNLGTVWANGIREHIIAAEDPISSAKLSLGLYRTQREVENSAKKSIRNTVRRHGGTKKDGRVLADRLIRITKIFQARRGVPEDPFLVGELSKKKVIFAKKSFSPSNCTAKSAACF